VDYVYKKGKIGKRYPLDKVMTALESLVCVEKASQFLKPGVTLGALHTQTCSMSDNEAAARLNEARRRLFLSIQNDLDPSRDVVSPTLALGFVDSRLRRFPPLRCASTSSTELNNNRLCHHLQNRSLRLIPQLELTLVHQQPCHLIAVSANLPA